MSRERVCDAPRNRIERTTGRQFHCPFAFSQLVNNTALVVYQQISTAC